jgi:hypothetical protein
MEEIISLVLASFGLVLLIVCILAVTIDLRSLINKIVYKLLNVWYNINVLK